jgi:hypothetical protein
VAASTTRVGTPRHARAAASRPTPQVLVETFKQWLSIRREVKTWQERQETLRKRLLEIVEAKHETDDRGSQYRDLAETVEFDGITYKSLKRERHLTPSEPTPDSELAEELLRKRGLWLTEAQEKQLARIQAANPYVSVSVEIDGKAVTNGYFHNVFSEAEYTDVLIPQKESWQFRPCE